MDKLMLKRFCGEEAYPIKKAVWDILEGDGTWDDPYSLWLEIECDAGESLNEDTINLDAKPNLDISFHALTLKDEDIKPGFILTFENEEEESEALLYYCDHQPTKNNRMEILERTGDTLLVKLTAETMDVNYYDGSKPDNKIELTTRFQFRG